jgi:hypothetical protein
VGIGSRVAEISQVLNILEIPPFKILFELGGDTIMDLLGYQMIHSAIQSKQGITVKKNNNGYLVNR